MILLSVSPPKWLAVIILFFLGSAWLSVLTIMNGVTQSILPDWVRGRSQAIYLTVFNGAMAEGSLAWGAIANIISIPLSLFIGAAGLIIIALVCHNFKLPAGNSDLSPSNHWPEPFSAILIEPERGPLLILIEYQVKVEQRESFIDAIHRLGYERRRDGAYRWGLAEDIADPKLMIEWFMVESWAEHLRHHQRITKVDADLQADVLLFHSGKEAPVVRHLLAVNIIATTIKAK